MPGSKVVSSTAEAVAGIPDGAVIMLDGFEGTGGTPQNLIRALRDQGARDLTIISNTAGLASVIGFGTVPGDRPTDMGILVDNDQVKKVIASCIEISISWPSPVCNFCTKAAVIESASWRPVPASPTVMPGRVGGPSGWPVTERAPPAACAIGSKLLKPEYGPVVPNPLRRA